MDLIVSVPEFTFTFQTPQIYSYILTLLLLTTSCPVLANSVDPDKLASEEAN